MPLTALAAYPALACSHSIRVITSRVQERLQQLLLGVTTCSESCGQLWNLRAELLVKWQIVTLFHHLNGKGNEVAF